MHLILTGATGLIGSAVLQHMLVNPSVTRISILSRRTVPQAQTPEAAKSGKVQVILHSDFNTYPSETLEKLRGAKGVVWALGISQTAVSPEEYEKITYDYTVAAANAFATLPSAPSSTLPEPASPSPTPFNFIYVSGEGATLHSSMFTPRFAIVKGRAEAALLSLGREQAGGRFRAFSVRPGGPDAAEHQEIWPFVPQRTGAMKVMESYLMPVLRRVVPGLVVPTRDLATVLTRLALGDGEPLDSSAKGIERVGEGKGRIVQNVGVRRLAGLDG
ncbi:Protein fmp52, mitochondrial [Phlyctema vagabunda]|uniref:Protein fmp52, mitochondrial n=1 Tax=Phlyctema vagabunda TaxID=108571 RepID=A0ABR4PMG2_9HELO